MPINVLYFGIDLDVSFFFKKKGGGVYPECVFKMGITTV